MKLKLLLFALLALIVANCTLDDPAVPMENEGKVVTVSVNLSPETRVLYDDSQVGSTAGALSWQTGDQLMLIGFNDSDVYQGQRTFTYSGSGNSFTFTGTLPAGATKYKGFYPASGVQLDANGDPVLVNGNPPIPGSTFWVQTQSGTGSVTHLSDKLLLSDTDANALTTPFNMQAVSSILKFNLSGIPNDLGTLTKLIWKVETTTGLFTSMTLGITGVSSGATSLMAYIAFDHTVMTIASNGKFSIQLIGNTKSYEWSTNSSATGKTYDAGKRYTATVSGGWTTAQSKFQYKIGLSAGTNYKILQKTATASPANLTIDWGDNTPTTSIPKGTTLTTTVSSHPYASKGDYIITIYSDEVDPTKIQIPQIVFISTSSGKYLKEVLTPFPNMGVTDFTSWFKKCPDLTSIPMGLFQNNPGATNFYECFASCGKLASIPLGLFYNNPNATNFSNCFANCILLTTMPDRMFRHSPNAVNFSRCFYGCVRLTLVPTMFPNPTIEPNFFANRGEVNWTQCFDSVGKDLATGTGTAPEIWKFNYDSVISTDCFKNASKLSNRNTIPINWGGNGPVYP